MIDADDDISSRKESQTTWQEYQTELNYGKENSLKQNEFNEIKARSSEKAEYKLSRASLSKSSIYTLPTTNMRKFYNVRPKSGILTKRRTRVERIYEYQAV